MTTWSFVAVPSTFKLVVYNLYTVKKINEKVEIGVKPY